MHTFAAWLLAAAPLARPETEPSLRIGLVADAQFNTIHADASAYRRGVIDTGLDVAIRPPALDFTAHHALRSVVLQLKERGTDVIFFLGDGANNGCRDELIGEVDKDAMDGVLTVLRRLRRDTQIPIFFLVGNHDILGAGNMAFNLRARRRLCNLANGDENPPLSKVDVLRQIHAFNVENQDPRFTYLDNWDAAALARACGGPRRQHKRRGCFLAARVRSAAPAIDFLLTDTTDYGDVISWRTAFAGLRGSISWKGSGSQTAWLTADPAPGYGRVVLSHDPIDDLNPVGVNSYGRPADLLRDHDRLWISAHTHNTTLSRRPHHFGDQPIDELNVGSTTDYPGYGVHVALAVDPSGTVTAPHPRPVYAVDIDACQGVLTRLSQQSAGGAYQPLRQHTRGLGLFGLDIRRDWTALKKEYRERSWRSEHDQIVRRNIRTFLAREPDPRAGTCIAVYAAIAEGIRDQKALTAAPEAELVTRAQQAQQQEQALQKSAPSPTAPTEEPAPAD